MVSNLPMLYNVFFSLYHSHLWQMILGINVINEMELIFSLYFRRFFDFVSYSHSYLYFLWSDKFFFCIGINICFSLIRKRF